MPREPAGGMGKPGVHHTQADTLPRVHPSAPGLAFSANSGNLGSPSWQLWGASGMRGPGLSPNYLFFI